jgi:hypothetical protein
MSNDNQYEIYSGQVNQFSSSFWIERKWIFDVEIKFVDVVYIIRPYRYIEKFLLVVKDGMMIQKIIMLIVLSNILNFLVLHSYILLVLCSRK